MKGYVLKYYNAPTDYYEVFMANAKDMVDYIHKYKVKTFNLYRRSGNRTDTDCYGRPKLQPMLCVQNGIVFREYEVPYMPAAFQKRHW